MSHRTGTYLGSERSAGLRILHVDDDIVVSGLVQFILQEQDELELAALDQAVTREEALRCLIDVAPYDVILLDHDLPDGTGLSMLGDIALHAPDSATVMLISNPDISVGITALERGATDVLNKAELGADALVTKIRLAQARKSYERELWSLAFTDPVTGLANRRGLEATHQIIAANAERRDLTLVVAIMDLNGFKRVNDVLGHAAGDDLLRQFASLLRAQSRGADGVARLGGDEFVVVGAVDHGAEITTVWRERIARVGFSLPSPEGTLEVSAAVGVASGTHSDSLDLLMAQADVEMYRDKASRSRAADPAPSSQAPDRVSPRVADAERAKLAEAITRAFDSNELIFHYQPIFTVPGRELVGYEALVRWERPGVGLEPPSVFLPFAMTGPMSRRLDSLALRDGVRSADRLNRAGTPARISVNVSGATLEDPAFADEVKATLTEFAVSPLHLTMEIIESTRTHPERSAPTLRALRSLGVQIGLDDFGTGFNGIALASQVQVDGVKIDRSFLVVEGQQRSTLEALVQASKRLGVSVLVEGVETEAQWDLACQLEVDLAQGFWLGRPALLPVT